MKKSTKLLLIISFTLALLFACALTAFARENLYCAHNNYSTCDDFLEPYHCNDCGIFFGSECAHNNYYISRIDGIDYTSCSDCFYAIKRCMHDDIEYSTATDSFTCRNCYLTVDVCRHSSYYYNEYGESCCYSCGKTSFPPCSHPDEYHCYNSEIDAYYCIFCKDYLYQSSCDHTQYYFDEGRNMYYCYECGKFVNSEFLGQKGFFDNMSWQIILFGVIGIVLLIIALPLLIILLPIIIILAILLAPVALIFFVLEALL